MHIYTIKKGFKPLTKQKKKTEKSMCKNCGLRPLERRRRREMLSCLKLKRSVLSSCGLGRQIG
jgi:hypothetical protein